MEMGLNPPAVVWATDPVTSLVAGPGVGLFLDRTVSTLGGLKPGLVSFNDKVEMEGGLLSEDSSLKIGLKPLCVSSGLWVGM